MPDDISETENPLAGLGEELGHLALEATEQWRRQRLEPVKLHFLDVLQRRLKTIDNDEEDRRVNAITELELCLKNWTERRSELLVNAREDLGPLYEQFDPIVGSEGIDRLVLHRLQSVSDDFELQAHKMMFREIGLEFDPEALA